MQKDTKRETHRDILRDRVERRTVNRGHGGSIKLAAVSKLRQYGSSHICLCLSVETLTSGGPFYLVAMPGEVKDPTQGVNM